MKILITENQLRKVQFKYLDYLFDGMHEIESEDYPDSRFWIKDGKVLLELEKSKFLLVNFTIWGDISNMFSSDYDETQQLIKKWFDARLNLEDIKPIKLQSTVN